MKEHDSFLAYTKHVHSSVTDAQAAKGLDKYDQELDPMDLKHNWTAMAIEENIDQLQYILAQQERNNYIARELRKTASLLVFSTGNVETAYHRIKHLADITDGSHLNET